jgi:hypothetical protein
LTTVDNDGLRRAAGKILGGMNLSEVITRERERADQANARAKEIEEENIAMLEEIEYLQAENEELQRQVSQSCPPPLYLLFVSVYSLHVAVGCIFRELIILLRPWSLSARIDE